MQVHLKIKIKSLAAEALFIRHEERKLEQRISLGMRVDRVTGRQYEKFRVVRNNSDRLELRRHRKFDVRSEQRHSLLAYAFMRGVPLASVDTGAWEKRGNALVPMVNWTKVSAMAKRFGADISGFEAWTKGVAPQAMAA